MGANVTIQWMDKSIPQNIKSVVSEPLQQLKMHVAVVAGLHWQPAHQWGDPSAVVWWMKALDRDVRNAPSLPSSDASLFYNSMLPFVYLPCKAQSSAETEEPRCLCTSMFCGAGMGFCLTFGLKLFGVLLSSHPPFVSVTVGASNGLYS